MANFYIADCHFGHKNIINFDHRPFADLYQMEEVMTMLWNAAVRKEDTVYILGDFCFGKEDDWLRLTKQLNGPKVLILGNHDPQKYSPARRARFLDIADSLEVADYDKNGVARKVILNHYPQPLYKQSFNDKYIMLCGHVHNTAENVWLEKWTRELREAHKNNRSFSGTNQGQIYNVGVCLPWMEYTPRKLDEIIRRWNLHHPEW